MLLFAASLAVLATNKESPGSTDGAQNWCCTCSLDIGVASNVLKPSQYVDFMCSKRLTSRILGSKRLCFGAGVKSYALNP